jgi:exportin-T
MSQPQPSGQPPLSADFERAVLCVFDQTGGVSPDTRQQAQDLLDALVIQTVSLFNTCLSHFDRSQHPEVQFWCLQGLHGLVRSGGYGELDATRKQALKQCLLRKGSHENSSLSLFLRNKLAQVIVAVAAIEYPDEWPTFFTDVLGSMTENPGSIDCFSRILISIHEDIISLEVPRSAEEAKQSMNFKDAMRDNAIEMVARSWHQILSVFKDTNPNLVALLLNGVERYVNWIDIGLVANERFMHLLFIVLNSPVSEAQVAAVGVLAEIVNKKMDSGPKLNLIQSLGLVPVAAQWSTTGLPGAADDDHSLAVASSKLLVSLAAEILDAWKKVENSVISLQTVGVSLEDDVIMEATASCQLASSMMEQLFPAVVSALRIPNDDISVIVAPFMLSYVSRLRMQSKRTRGELAPALQSQMVSLLEGVAVCSRFGAESSLYPINYTSVDERVVAEEEEQSITFRRQEVFSLFRNASKLIPSMAFDLVAKMLQSSLILSDGNIVWQDAEIALTLFYQLGEGLTEDVFKAGTHPSVDLAAGIIQLNEDVAYHRLVALALLEACARYSKVTLFRRELLPLLASKFFGKAGLGHPSSSVPPRAAYLLCRTVKSLRRTVSAIARDVLVALMPHLEAIANSPLEETGSSLPLGLVAAGASGNMRGVSGAGVSTPDDRLFAFEAAGLLVGNSDNENMQVEWLHGLHQPLVDLLKRQNVSTLKDALVFRQSIEALTRLSKGFSPKMCASRPTLSQVLIEPLGPAIQAVKMFPMSKDLRAKFLAYVHRLVECLGDAIVPHLPTVFWSLEHPGLDAGDFKDILVLVNQIVIRYNNNVTIIDSMVVPLFADCSAKVREFLGGDWDWTMRKAMEGVEDHGTGSSEDLREKVELQKQYYSLINSVSQCTSIIDRVLAKDSVPIADVFQGAVSNVDAGVRKLCIATLGAVVHHWIKGYSDQEDVKQLACIRFGCDVLLFSLLIKPEAGGIDVRDAASISLLTEVSNQVKVLYGALGDTYLEALHQQTTTRLGWSPQLAQEVTAQIREAEGRQLRMYLKSMFVEYRKM